MKTYIILQSDDGETWTECNAYEPLPYSEALEAKRSLEMWFAETEFKLKECAE